MKKEDILELCLFVLGIAFVVVLGLFVGSEKDLRKAEAKIEEQEVMLKCLGAI